MVDNEDLQRRIETLEAVCESNKRAYVGAVKDLMTMDEKLKKLQDQNRRGRRAIAEIKALHHEYRGPFDEGRYCAHCNQISGTWIPYPCPTVQALEGM
jgi:hypothetical protein